MDSRQRIGMSKQMSFDKVVVEGKKIFQNAQYG